MAWSMPAAAATGSTSPKPISACTRPSSISPTIGAWIGLGLVKGGLDRPEGERLFAYDPLRGGNVEVEICREVFYDPKEERLRG